MKHGLIGLLTITILLVSTACGSGNNSPADSSIDAQMTIHFEEETLTVGETTIIITLNDENDVPIDGAVLHVHGDMDHEGMIPVIREIDHGTDGEYHVPFEWTMGGGWIVTVTADLPNNGGELTETFEYFVEAASRDSIINHPSQTNHGTNSDHVNIAYNPDNDPAFAGNATITITLTDEHGDPITDATVDIVGDMNHHGMVPITETGEHSEDGIYIVSLRWTMAGDWHITVTVTMADGTVAEAAFDQQVIMR